MTRRLFVSDLHLESTDSDAFRRFEELLQAHAATGHEIYLLGDIVEMWIGDDDDAPLAEGLRRLLAEVAGQTAVSLMAGNRDFLFGDALAAATGVSLIAEPTGLADGTLIAHGDEYCTDDTEYQQFRALVRSVEWQADTLGKPLAERRAMGEALRARSRETNANKASNIMDVNAEAIESALREHQCERLVHGHTHRPGRHAHQHGQRLVLGAWERCAWFITQENDCFALKCWPLSLPYSDA